MYRVYSVIFRIFYVNYRRVCEGDSLHLVVSVCCLLEMAVNNSLDVSCWTGKDRGRKQGKAMM